MPTKNCYDTDSGSVITGADASQFYTFRFCIIFGCFTATCCMKLYAMLLKADTKKPRSEQVSTRNAALRKLERGADGEVCLEATAVAA
jgi:hypothetical protein